MTFNVKAFKQEKFKVRTEDVPVPDLKQWFKKGTKAVWKVRGLKGKEVGVAKVAAAKNKSLAGIITMLQSAKVAEKTEAMEAVMDMAKDQVPENIAERLEHMILGSVKPKCDINLALKVCERYPVDFYNITTRILKLTGLGMMPGKHKRSGKKPT
ncbi:MAG: hypothetical protein GY941_23715 [Planctomycetes bacterium]|nr:hypothetical protein [Planctomycetota bacterium]